MEGNNNDDKTKNAPDLGLIHSQSAQLLNMISSSP